MRLDVPAAKFSPKMNSCYAGPPKPEREPMAMFELLVPYIHSIFICRFCKEKGWLLISALANHA